MERIFDTSEIQEKALSFCATDSSTDELLRRTVSAALKVLVDKYEASKLDLLKQIQAEKDPVKAFSLIQELNKR